MSLQSDGNDFPVFDDPDMDISVEHSEMAANLLSQQLAATQLSQLEAFPDTGDVVSLDAYEAMIADFKALCNTVDGKAHQINKAIKVIHQLNTELTMEEAQTPGLEANLVFPDTGQSRKRSNKRKKAFYEK